MKKIFFVFVSCLAIGFLIFLYVRLSPSTKIVLNEQECAIKEAEWAKEWNERMEKRRSEPQHPQVARYDMKDIYERLGDKIAEGMHYALYKIEQGKELVVIADVRRAGVTLGSGEILSNISDPEGDTMYFVQHVDAGEGRMGSSGLWAFNKKTKAFKKLKSNLSGVPSFDERYIFDQGIMDEQYEVRSLSILNLEKDEIKEVGRLPTELTYTRSIDESYGTHPFTDIFWDESNRIHARVFSAQPAISLKSGPFEYPEREYPVCTRVVPIREEVIDVSALWSN
ncbi:hypothetical protein EXS71_01775 [Candidatus Uhrbacteria bacterium]|nr:hypothetical protein [Candidatus Uhrbacteria bacterium]